MPEGLNWKGQALFHVVRWVLPVAGAILLLVLLWAGPRAPWLLPAWRRFGVSAWILTRPVYAVVLYVLLDYRGSGDFSHWLRWAREAQEGGMPGRDFGLGYGPLYTWLHAGGLALVPHASGFGLLLPVLVGDAVAVFATAAVARDRVSGPFGAWMGLMLLASPLLWHEAVVGAQDEPLFAGFLAGTWLLLHRGRLRSAGLLLALGLLSTKITFLVYAAFLLAPWWREPRALAGILGPCLALLLAVYGPLVAMGLPVVPMGAISAQGGVLGIALPAILTMISGVASGPVVIGGSLLLLAAAGVWTLGRPAVGAPLDRSVPASTLGHAAFMALMPGCMAAYGTQGIAPVTWFLGADPSTARRRAMGIPYVGVVLLTALGWSYGYAYFPWWVPAAFVGFHLALAGRVLSSTRPEPESRPGDPS